MAIYHDDSNKQANDTFRPPTPPPEPPTAPRRRSAAPLMLSLLLVTGLLGGGLLVAWVVFQPQVQLRSPVDQSVPYTSTAAYISAYDEVIDLVGADNRASVGPKTEINWSFTGTGTARIHLIIQGEAGQTEAFSTWERERESWLVTQASYLNAAGDQVGIPLGSGSFLSRYDLAAWRAADPSSQIGRAQRELIEGRPIQSIQLLTGSLAADPEQPEALLWRGRAFEEVGNVPKALADYQRVLTLDPEHAAAMARLDGLRASPPPGLELAPRPEGARPPVTSLRPTSLIPE